MTKLEFFNLPTNKATVTKLQNISDILFNSDSVTWVFYSEVIGHLKEYIYSRKNIKKIIDKPTTKNIYESYERVKKNGYRKELVLPF